MALQEQPQDGELNDLLSSGEPNDRGNSKRICPPTARPFCRVWERAKNLFCSGIGCCRGIMEPEEKFPLCHNSIRLSFGFILPFVCCLFPLRLKKPYKELNWTFKFTRRIRLVHVETRGKVGILRDVGQGFTELRNAPIGSR
ncbi:hypothetical protein P5673_028430 [Acropora cervicornis]|uniref:Uncharacterized protein n=1 Tax=Acropora cervicornis TaxID=6130 RepID=A0AAD9UUT0_ACRCE|nr:hypothetical protein P5673_028430 [Acropora cervicornis]